MRRRRALIALSGAITGLAGCNTLSGSQGSNTQTDGSSQDQSGQQSAEELLNDERVSVQCREQMDELGRCGPNIVQIAGIKEHTDDKLTLRLVTTRLADYKLRVYQHVPTAENPGKFGVEATYINSAPRYDEDKGKYVPPTDTAFDGLRTVVKYPKSTGELLSEELVPGLDSPNTNDNLQRDEARGYDHVTLEVPVSKPPNGVPVTYSIEPVEHVFNEYGFDYQPHIVSWSQQVFRDIAGEYVYAPRQNHANIEAGSPTLVGTSVGNHVIRNNQVDLQDGGKRCIFGRMSDYSIYSPRFGAERIIERNREREWDARKEFVAFITEFGDARVNRVRVRPFELTFEISGSEIEQARVDNNNYPHVGRSPLRRRAEDDDLINQPAVQRVASQLGEIATRLGATRPVEHTRFVASFVQFLDYNLENQSYSKSPTETLFDAGGDCEDLALLMYALLSQDEFDVDPAMAYIDTGDTSVIPVNRREEQQKAITYAHISVGVPLDIEPSEREKPFYKSGEFSSFDIDGERHVYVECVMPALLGWKTDEWGKPELL